MPTAAELNVKINSTLDESGFDRAEQRVQGLGSRLGTALGTAGGFLLANAVQAVASNIGQLASEGLNFEAAMANVNSIAQLSATQLQELSDQVLQLANNPGITQGPAELAAGLYNIASSGFAGADGLKVLEASAIAATAGLTSSETAATAITAALNAYGLEADSARGVSDILFQTVNEGVITFDQLANNLGNTLAPAASLGVGLEELGAAYARLTLSGVQASQAETQIAALMRSALNPTEALTSAVQAQGYASATAAIEAEGMSGFLKILTEASGGSQEELFNLLGTTEAMNAALLLGGDNLDEYIESVTRMGEASEGAGATQTALNKQMQSASFRIAKMRQQLQVAATMFMGFLAPGISAAAEGLTRFISGGLIPFVDIIGTALRGGFEFRDAIDALPEPLQRTAGAVGSIAEAIGDLIRAFQDRGIGGLFDTLFTGGEGQQIVTALTAIADEAFNGLMGAFQAINWGAVWDVAVQAIQGLAAAGIDLGSFIVSAAIDLGGDLLSAAGNLWGWVLGKLFGNDTIASGVAAVTGAAGIGDGVAGSRDISLGDIIVQGALRLGEGLLAAAGNLWGWVEAQLGYGSSGTIGPMPGVRNGTGSFNVRSGDNNIQLGDVLIDGALSLGETLKQWAGNLWGWIDEQLQPSKDTGNPHIVDVIIDGAVTLGVGLAEIAGNLSGWLQRQIMGGTGDPNSGSPGQVANGGGSGIVVEIAQIAIDVLDAIADVTAADIEGWIQEQVDTLGTIVGEINDWRIVLNGQPEITQGPGGAAYGGGSTSGLDGWGINKWIQEQTDKINGENGWVIDATNWVLRISGNPDMQVDNLEDWNNLIQEGIESGGIEQGAIDALNTIGTAIDLAFVGFMQDIGNTLRSVGEFVGEAWDWVKDLFDVDISIPAPSFDTSGILSAVDGLVSFIGEQIGRIASEFDRLLFWQKKAANPGAYAITNPGGASFPEATINMERDFDAIGAYPNADLPMATPLEIPAPNTREFDRVMGEIPGRVQTKMSEAQTSANTYATGIGTVVGTQIGAMVGNVTALMGAFTNAVGQGMSNALSAASVYSGAIVSAVSAAFGQLPAIAASTTGQIPGIIAGNLAAAAATAFSSGAAIGQGLAAGMNSTLGQVQAAAASLAAAAAQAAAARLQIASPSKVFTRMGEQVGDGFVIGIQSRYGAAGSAGAGLAGATIPTTAAAAYGRRGGSGNTVVINALKSDELVRLIEKAERGGQFAIDFPQLVRQGAY